MVCYWGSNKGLTDNLWLKITLATVWQMDKIREEIWGRKLLGSCDCNQRRRYKMVTSAYGRPEYASRIGRIVELKTSSSSRCRKALHLPLLADRQDINCKGVISPFTTRKDGSWSVETLVSWRKHQRTYATNLPNHPLTTMRPPAIFPSPTVSLPLEA